MLMAFKNLTGIPTVLIGMMMVIDYYSFPQYLSLFITSDKSTDFTATGNEQDIISSNQLPAINYQQLIDTRVQLITGTQFRTKLP